MSENQLTELVEVIQKLTKAINDIPSKICINSNLDSATLGSIIIDIRNSLTKISKELEKTNKS